MAYRPPKDPNDRPNLFPERKKNSFVIFLQLLGLFLAVRLVMVETGVMFIRIPYIDDAIVTLLTFIKRQLTLFGIVS
jgi:hypothetical protein